MKTTLGFLTNAEPALGRLSAQRMPAKIAYQIARMCRLVSVEVKHFNEQREALIKELGEPHGEQIQVPQAKMLEFVTRINELASVDVDIDIVPIPFESITDISAADILALGDLLASDEPVKAEESAKRPRGAMKVAR